MVKVIFNPPTRTGRNDRQGLPELWRCQTAYPGRLVLQNKDISDTTVNIPAVTTVYADSPREFNFITLQTNLQNCLSIVDNEVMKNYVPELQHCDVVPLEKSEIEVLEQIQFFATINGKRMQCYDMIDNGLIDESTFDSVVKEIATQIRLSPEYKNGEVNKLQFTLVI